MTLCLDLLADWDALSRKMDQENDQKWSTYDLKNFQILVKKVPQNESEIWPLTDPG